jgi:LacI family gluconate utilization system Gnt-I transcriptional repressor
VEVIILRDSDEIGSVAADAIESLLARKPDVDAVFCSSDLLALGLITEAGARGLAVPQRLAVVGFGDLEFGAALEPALTTVHIKGAAIGRQAAQFIVDRAEGRDVAQRVVDIGFHIVQRRSA